MNLCHIWCYFLCYFLCLLGCHAARKFPHSRELVVRYAESSEFGEALESPDRAELIERYI